MVGLLERRGATFVSEATRFGEHAASADVAIAPFALRVPGAPSEDRRGS